MKISKMSQMVWIIMLAILTATFWYLFPPFIHGVVKAYPVVGIRLDVPWLGYVIIAVVITLSALGMHLNVVSFARFDNDK